VLVCSFQQCDRRKIDGKRRISVADCSGQEDRSEGHVVSRDKRQT
jgi:hypothetical protein